MNNYCFLKDETPDVTIESDNQLRNKKKLLKKKQEKFKLNPSENLTTEIATLASSIEEYKNRNSVSLKKSKKQIESDNNKLVQESYKKESLKRHKQRVKDARIAKLRKKCLNPRWSIKNHTLFPCQDKKCITILLMGQLRDNCILSLLPKEAIVNILSNIHWNDFLKIKKHCQRKKKINKKLFLH